ncbi:hypothetical protein NE237_005453 [Protea cynaroides]|uniref:Late embryogenesis abundant protein LEA-2 subgroup domain-containing protein n=1 Tax=Protea cynaroides TaxID=273540 RepID=A0A9Q0KLC3_9MAGN|nr:hypothetical protein NE237_005453 [Protea cynaroides]
MANQRVDGEDQEVLYSSYALAVYYVQSPSTVSHANSNNESALLSPYPYRSDQNFITNPCRNPNREVARLLSRYSSSRGSNNSFNHHEKKISYDGHESQGTICTENRDICLINYVEEVEHEEKEDKVVVDDDDDDDDDDDESDQGDGRRHGCWRFFSFGTSPSFAWICLQLSWRFMVSLGVALLLFYLVTKPPPPKVSIKISGIQQFRLGQGVDGSGVTTNLLTCNCSMKLLIDNKSKLYGLHIHPPLIDMSFERFLFASSQGLELYAKMNGPTTFRLYVGTRNKAMYGAGRNMEDILESGKGLQLIIRMRLSSSFRVVWNLIRPRFHHHADCVLVLNRRYDKLHYTQAYNSSCRITPYS